MARAGEGGQSIFVTRLKLDDIPSDVAIEHIMYVCIYIYIYPIDIYVVHI